MPAVVALEDVGDGAVVDDVAIPFPDRIAQRVKRFGDLDRFEDGDIFGQFGVQGALEDAGREAAFSAETGHLAQGVNARVSSPAADDPDPLAGDFGQRRFEHLLHRLAPRLDLPARISGAVVGERELEVRMGRRWSFTCLRGRAATRRSGRRWLRRPCGCCR